MEEVLRKLKENFRTASFSPALTSYSSQTDDDGYTALLTDLAKIGFQWHVPKRTVFCELCQKQFDIAQILRRNSKNSQYELAHSRKLLQQLQTVHAPSCAYYCAKAAKGESFLLVHTHWKHLSTPTISEGAYKLVNDGPLASDRLCMYELMKLV